MTYLLDTNAASREIGRRPSSVKTRLRAVPPHELRLCTVVEAELRFGAEKSAYPTANLALVDRFVARFLNLPFDPPAAKEYGRLRLTLERAGTPIGPNDLMIASIALAHGLTLVTHNVPEFARVPSLRVEDWEA